MFYVYIIYNPITNQPMYVGKGTGRRMYQHKLDAKKSPNPTDFHKKINEIHSNGHSLEYHKVLITENETKAFNEERRLIELYGRLNDETGILYNRTGGGGTTQLSPEALENKRIKSSKAVNQYDLDGNFIARFDSAKMASEQTTGSRSYITQCCKLRRKTSGGYQWRYVTDDAPGKMTKANYSAVQQYDLDGVLLNEFRSLTEAQNATNVELHNISEACRGKSATAGGFVWKYKN